MRHLSIFFALHVLTIAISLGSVEDTPSQARYLFNSNDHFDHPRRLTAAYAAAATVGPGDTSIPSSNLGTADLLRAQYIEPANINVTGLTSDSSDPLYMDESAVYPVTREDIGGYGDIHYHVMFPQDLAQNPVQGIVVHCYPWVEPEEATKSTLSQKFSEASSGLYWVQYGYLSYTIYTQPLHIIRKKEQIVTTVRDVAHFMHHLKTRTPDVRGKYVYFPKNLNISTLKIFLYGGSAGGYLSMLVATYPERMRSHDGKYTFRASEYIDGFIANAPRGHPEWDANDVTGRGQKRHETQEVLPEESWFFDAQQDPATYQEILPMNNLIHLDTPILLLHNVFDDNVSVLRSLDFISQALKDEITAQHGHLLVHALLYRSDATQWRSGSHNDLIDQCEQKVFHAAIQQLMAGIRREEYIGSDHLVRQSELHKRALHKMKEISHLLYRSEHLNPYLRNPFHECVRLVLTDLGYIPSADWAFDNIFVCKATLAFVHELKKRGLTLEGLERQTFDEKMMALKAYRNLWADANGINYMRGLPSQDPTKVEELKRIYEDLKDRYKEDNIERKDIETKYFIA